ncbi:ribosyldihydronicotinamide dehydrogenase [quinone]-like [Eucyclogobius newberryi]|uniref:ribosyldihydronicotinamide dehydrogenase [quinone]-like n=1 Tax=Eucyclogobius newberryi TaxID=166745 RepID=UPI003B59A86E
METSRLPNQAKFTTDQFCGEATLSLSLCSKDICNRKTLNVHQQRAPPAEVRTRILVLFLLRWCSVREEGPLPPGRAHSSRCQAESATSEPQSRSVTRTKSCGYKRAESTCKERGAARTRRSAEWSVLIVYAHQSPNSFNAAVKDVAVKELEKQGYKVMVSDLYAMEFKASATRQDINGELKSPDLFRYGEEMQEAWSAQTLSDDIKDEHKKVQEADLIIFQFPLYWFSVPAIMKGWFDRVLVGGFAFSLEKMYDNGIFKEKKAMLSFTTGAMESMFRSDGINGDINVTLWPLQNGVLYFCGFQVLAPQIFWSPAHCPDAVRAAMLESWGQRLKGLLSESPLQFASCKLFDLSFQGGFCLRPDAKKERESQTYGITTGHHLGKPLPPDQQLRAPPGGAGGKH